MATITNTPSRDWESTEAAAEWEAIHQAASTQQRVDHLAAQKDRAAIRGLVLASIHETNMRALAAERADERRYGTSTMTIAECLAIVQASNQKAVA